MESRNKPKLIGVTGGIGSGKSIVCKIFSSLGHPVYDADSMAKWLMNHDQKLKDQIIENFGSHAYRADGLLDNVYLAQHVFKDTDKLAKLNSLVHPAVHQDTKEWAEKHNDYPLLIKEAALLFETGSYKSLDQTILVAADEETRISRILERDPHRDRYQVEAIIARQMSESQKMGFADYIIYNDESHSLLDQVLGFLQSTSSSQHIAG